MTLGYRPLQPPDVVMEDNLNMCASCAAFDAERQKMQKVISFLRNNSVDCQKMFKHSSQLESEIKTLNSTIQQRESDNLQLRIELASSEKQLAKTMSDMMPLQGRVTDLEQRQQNFLVQRERLETEVASSKQMIDQMTEELKQREFRIAEQTQKYQELVNKYRESSAALKRMDTNMNSLKADIRNSEVNRELVTNFRDRLRRLAKFCERLSSQLKANGKLSAIDERMTRKYVQNVLDLEESTNNDDDLLSRELDALLENSLPEANPESTSAAPPVPTVPNKTELPNHPVSVTKKPLPQVTSSDTTTTDISNFSPLRPHVPPAEFISPIANGIENAEHLSSSSSSSDSGSGSDDSSDGDSDSEDANVEPQSRPPGSAGVGSVAPGHGGTAEQSVAAKESTSGPCSGKRRIAHAPKTVSEGTDSELTDSSPRRTVRFIDTSPAKQGRRGRPPINDALFYLRRSRNARRKANKQYWRHWRTQLQDIFVVKIQPILPDKSLEELRELVGGHNDDSVSVSQQPGLSSAAKQHFPCNPALEALRARHRRAFVHSGESVSGNEVIPHPGDDDFTEIQHLLEAMVDKVCMLVPADSEASFSNVSQHREAISKDELRRSDNPLVSPPLSKGPITPKRTRLARANEEVRAHAIIPVYHPPVASPTRIRSAALAPVSQVIPLGKKLPQVASPCRPKPSESQPVKPVNNSIAAPWSAKQTPVTVAPSKAIEKLRSTPKRPTPSISSLELDVDGFLGKRKAVEPMKPSAVSKKVKSPATGSAAPPAMVEGTKRGPSASKSNIRLPKQLSSLSPGVTHPKRSNPGGALLKKSKQQTKVNVSHRKTSAGDSAKAVAINDSLDKSGPRVLRSNSKSEMSPKNSKPHLSEKPTSTSREISDGNDISSEALTSSDLLEVEEVIKSPVSSRKRSRVGSSSSESETDLVIDDDALSQPSGSTNLSRDKIESNAPKSMSNGFRLNEVQSNSDSDSQKLAIDSPNEHMDDDDVNAVATTSNGDHALSTSGAISDQKRHSKNLADLRKVAREANALSNAGAKPATIRQTAVNKRETHFLHSHLTSMLRQDKNAALPIRVYKDICDSRMTFSAEAIAEAVIAVVITQSADMLQNLMQLCSIRQTPPLPYVSKVEKLTWELLELLSTTEPWSDASLIRGVLQKSIQAFERSESLDSRQSSGICRLFAFVAEKQTGVTDIDMLYGSFLQKMLNSSVSHALGNILSMLAISPGPVKSILSRSTLMRYALAANFFDKPLKVQKKSTAVLDCVCSELSPLLLDARPDFGTCWAQIVKKMSAKKALFSVSNTSYAMEDKIVNDIFPAINLIVNYATLDWLTQTFLTQILGDISVMQSRFESNSLLPHEEQLFALRHVVCGQALFWLKLRLDHMPHTEQSPKLNLMDALIKLATTLVECMPPLLSSCKPLAKFAALDASLRVAPVVPDAVVGLLSNTDLIDLSNYTGLPKSLIGRFTAFIDAYA